MHTVCCKIYMYIIHSICTTFTQYIQTGIQRYRKEAHGSRPSQKEHPESGCEICYVCTLAVTYRGPTDVDDAPAH